MHACGKYFHNSVFGMLMLDHGFGNLHGARAAAPVTSRLILRPRARSAVIHRLDRLTSGLLLLGRSPGAAKRFSADIADRSVEKIYVSRVRGEFPEGDISCDQPVLPASHVLGVCVVRADGKSALTTFRRLSFNGTTSVVECRPKTGRMHQIRVHLQYLGVL